MPDQHEIGWAVKQMLDGQKVRRSGWTGLWLIYVPATPDVTTYPGSPYGKAGLNDIDIEAHIDMYTAQGTMQPGWLASQADLLAIDWELA